MSGSNFDFLAKSHPELAQLAPEGDLEAALAEEAEAKQERLAKRVARLQAPAHEATDDEHDAAVRRVVEAAAVELDEADIRKIIDQQLREAGWEADSENLRHSKGARPQKGRHLAIAEWPTANGPADYVLFRGLEAVAVVEAKRRHKRVAGVLDQAKRYARTFRDDEFLAAGAPWGELKVPFLFATNGRPWGCSREMPRAPGRYADPAPEASLPRVALRLPWALSYNPVGVPEKPSDDHRLE